MSDSLIYLKSFTSPIVDKNEVLRYAGVRESSTEVEELLDECIRESEKVLTYNVCYRVFHIELGEDIADLGFATVNSHSLIKTLEGSDGAVVFCATVGVGIDRLIAKYNAISPTKAVLMQALGSERVEALCEEFCSFVKCELSDVCTRRFSPGYGDLPLDIQREVFSSLDCTRRLGVNLSSNLFMTPTKSVTAIIGIKM